MRKLVAGLIFLSLMGGSCAYAQDRRAANRTARRNRTFRPAASAVSAAFSAAPRQRTVTRSTPRRPPLPSYVQPAIPGMAIVWSPAFGRGAKRSLIILGAGDVGAASAARIAVDAAVLEPR